MGCGWSSRDTCVCQRRDFEDKGSGDILISCAVSLDNGNLTLLSSFGKLIYLGILLWNSELLGYTGCPCTWGAAIVVLILLILKMGKDMRISLFLGCPYEESTTLFWRFYRNYPPRVWVHNSFSVVDRNRLENRKYIKVNRFHKDQFSHRAVWRGSVLRSEEG